jgi:hypothetical protein
LAAVPDPCCCFISRKALSLARMSPSRIEPHVIRAESILVQVILWLWTKFCTARGFSNGGRSPRQLRPQSHSQAG